VKNLVSARISFQFLKNLAERIRKFRRKAETFQLLVGETPLPLIGKPVHSCTYHPHPEHDILKRS
jgi:hypothetical protein